MEGLGANNNNKKATVKAGKNYQVLYEAVGVSQPSDKHAKRLCESCHWMS
jgi:hypothetical protein